MELDTTECELSICYYIFIYCIQDTLSSRALGLSAFRLNARASKGIMHTSHHCTVDIYVFERYLCSRACIQDTLSSRAALGLPAAAFRPSASREQRYLAYNSRAHSA